MPPLAQVVNLIGNALELAIRTDAFKLALLAELLHLGVKISLAHEHDFAWQQLLKWRVNGLLNFPRPHNGNKAILIVVGARVRHHAPVINTMAGAVFRLHGKLL